MTIDNRSSSQVWNDLINPPERNPMNTDPNSNPPFRFSDVIAEIVYEYINPGDGQWHLHKQTVYGGDDRAYASIIREVYAGLKAEQEGRQDKRNLRIQVRPAAPDWVEVPFAPDTNLADIEGTLHACRHARWTPAPIPSITPRDFVNGLIVGGTTNIA